jgi:hypothetical protein
MILQFIIYNFWIYSNLLQKCDTMSCLASLLVLSTQACNTLHATSISDIVNLYRFLLDVGTMPPSYFRTLIKDYSIIFDSVTPSWDLDEFHLFLDPIMDIFIACYHKIDMEAMHSIMVRVFECTKRIPEIPDTRLFDFIFQGILWLNKKSCFGSLELKEYMTSMFLYWSTSRKCFVNEFNKYMLCQLVFEPLFSSFTMSSLVQALTLFSKLPDPLLENVSIISASCQWLDSSKAYLFELLFNVFALQLLPSTACLDSNGQQMAPSVFVDVLDDILEGLEKGIKVLESNQTCVALGLVASTLLLPIFFTFPRAQTRYLKRILHIYISSDSHIVCLTVLSSLRELFLYSSLNLKQNIKSSLIQEYTKHKDSNHERILALIALIQ